MGCNVPTAFFCFLFCVFRPTGNSCNNRNSYRQDKSEVNELAIHCCLISSYCSVRALRHSCCKWPKQSRRSDVDLFVKVSDYPWTETSTISNATGTAKLTERIPVFIYGERGERERVRKPHRDIERDRGLDISLGERNVPTTQYAMLARGALLTLVCSCGSRLLGDVDAFMIYHIHRHFQQCASHRIRAIIVEPNFRNWPIL